MIIKSSDLESVLNIMHHLVDGIVQFQSFSEGVLVSSWNDVVHADVKVTCEVGTAFRAVNISKSSADALRRTMSGPSRDIRIKVLANDIECCLDENRLTLPILEKQFSWYDLEYFAGTPKSFCTVGKLHCPYDTGTTRIRNSVMIDGFVVGDTAEYLNVDSHSLRRVNAYTAKGSLIACVMPTEYGPGAFLVYSGERRMFALKHQEVEE